MNRFAKEELLKLKKFSATGIPENQPYFDLKVLSKQGGTLEST
jgi:hypothetical protein